jgi:FkbM family methyltransferase
VTPGRHTLARRIGGAQPARAPALLALRVLQRSLRRRPTSRLLRAAAFRLGLALASDDHPLPAPLRDGGVLYVDPRDPAQREILLFGQTDRGVSALLRCIATRGWTVLDVGANAGYYTILSAALGGEDARIHAFEPNPRMAALIERSAAAASDGSGITVIRAGCGAAAGNATLHLSGDPSLVAFATLDEQIAWSEDWERVEVEVVSLDDHCDAHGLQPDLVKIDAEGFEPQILEGMRRLLRRRVPRYLVCEAIRGQGRPDPAGIEELLATFSYAVHLIGDHGELRRPEPGEAYSGNVCFMAL